MYDHRKLEAAQERLVRAIAPLVERHRTVGAILTWRLLHEIEDEAFLVIEAGGGLDPSYTRMMRSSTMKPYWVFQRTDQAVDFSNYGCLPLAFSFIEQAYRISH